MQPMTMTMIIAVILAQSCSYLVNEKTEEKLQKKSQEKSQEKPQAIEKPIHTDTHPKKDEPVALSTDLQRYCGEIENSFDRYKWGKSRCENYQWHHVRNSQQGRPLIWKTFGPENNEKRHTTIVLCGVHGDEITPVKFCFDLIEHLVAHEEDYRGKTIVVAPIVAPDSFFNKPPTRTNANGVDVNRNFPTQDWDALAVKLWREKYRSDKRRFPGNKALSEAEVLFQINLIKRYDPSKIISVHAPLTLLDYDGPSVLTNHPHEQEHAEINRQGKVLLKKMSEHAKGYKVIDYPVFPGSLGNWAGREQLIPTYTLELPTSDHTKHQTYWEMFAMALQDAILHEFH